jgi:hypothetical protein
MIDFSSFRLSDTCNWLWYENGLTDAEVQAAPPGFQFSALYAPIHNLKRWTVTHFEIRTVKDWKHNRAYVVMERLELDYAPFEWQPKLEKPWQPQVKLIDHVEWDAYLRAEKVSEEFMARLRAELGSAA